MPVFVSHRTADDSVARNVATRLKVTHGIECYVDDIDKALGQARGTAEVTRLIVNRLVQCSNLLAIVTPNTATAGSWWVPFEIGVVRQAPRPITTYTNLQDNQLPEYLLEWPRLRGDSAVDAFARLYKQQKSALTEQVLQKRATASAQVTLVEQFEKALKAALGQT